MGVESFHPAYKAAFDLWTKVRDCIEGEEAVKARGPAYLPKLGAHLEDGAEGESDYQAYKQRAMFYGAAGRTVTALTGAVMRKDPDVAWPAAREEALKSITKDRKPVRKLWASVVQELVGVGRVGVLVDDDADTENEDNPFAVMYRAEDVTNWRLRKVKDRLEPVLVVLREERQQPKEDDFFEVESIDVRRVLRLGFFPNLPPELRFERNSQGEVEELPIEIQLSTLGLQLSDIEEPVYWQEVWVKQVDDEGEDEWVHEDTVVPKMKGGRVFREIPFVMFNDEELGFDASEPPLLDLCNVNLSHYRTMADLEHGRHWTALPTAVAFGFPEVDKEGNPVSLRVGAQEAWITEQPQGSASYLEFSGQGLGHLATGAKDKERLMAVLGARLLEEPPTSGVEAAETVKLRQAGERSVLARIAMTASDGLSKVMFLLASWVQPTVREDTIGVKLSTDFDVSKLDPTTLVALVQMTQAGLMSWQTLFWNIKRGEYVPDDVTEEDELSRIEQTMALLGLGRPEPGEEEGESGEEDEDDEEGGDDEDDEDDEEEDDEGEEE